MTDILFVENESMAKHVTFRAGGNARLFATPRNVEKLKSVLEYIRKNNIEYIIMGNGSNMLVKDTGYDGAIVKISEGFDTIDIVEENDRYLITVGAGAMLGRVANEAAKLSLTGMEALAGIPGTIGGAVAMNAGAYGTEIKDVIVEATILDTEGNIKTYTRDELDLSYRHSKVQENNDIVISAKFELKKGDKEAIEVKMAEHRNARIEKQPLEYPSAGSTFKRPEGYFAGKLIEDAGLRGYRVGGAEVSEKHCGFVINKDNATATDIVTLIADVTRIVKDKFGVELEPEVKILG